MPKRSFQSQSSNRLAYWFAFKHLCNLVCRDPEFIRDRTTILQAHDWVAGHHEEILSFWYLIMRRIPGALQDVIRSVNKLTTRYGFDALPNGDYFMFLMVFLGRPPELLDRHRPFVWMLEIPVRPDESFVDAMRAVKIDMTQLTEKFRPVPIDDDYSNEFPWVSNLEQMVEWYFRVKATKRATITKVAADAGFTFKETQISRGIRQAQRILGVPVRRGRPLGK